MEEIKTIKQKFDDCKTLLLLFRKITNFNYSISQNQVGDFDLTGFEVSSVAGVLKLYLRELPEPLFPFQFYPTLINIASLFIFYFQFFIYTNNRFISEEHSHDEPKLLENLRNAILAMPEQNSELIFFLTNFLQVKFYLFKFSLLLTPYW